MATVTVRPWTVRRDLRSLTADREKRLLVRLARQVPAAVGPDHLTALGLAAYAVAGAAYARSADAPAWLWIVNLALVVNWLGDSLDGTVARVREVERPRYGFYVDHLVDGVGITMLLLGLACSGLASPALAMALLVAYLLLQLHIALATCATGTFTMAMGGIGGTELRLLLILVNGLVGFVPAIEFDGWRALTFDLVLTGALAGLLATLAGASSKLARALDRQERRDSQGGEGLSPRPSLARGSVVAAEDRAEADAAQH